jgi:3-hydroxyanthranilate 3,4-dioxygenase
MPRLSPINLKQWIEAHRHLLKPPVGNQQVWEDADFLVTVVGGPNTRRDYHVDVGEEFFYQLEGDMILKVVEDGKHRDLTIREGEIFLLPPRVPHSPQRPPGTLGLVIERKRRPEEKDGFIWFCEKCGNKLYEEFLHVSNLVDDLPPIFDRFYNEKSVSTCRNCGTEHLKANAKN